MRLAPSLAGARRFASLPPVLCLLAALAAPGCGHHEKTEYTTVSKPPTVRIIQPEVRKIVRVVGQPSFIESYERTSVYPKLTAYIDKWIVDIGDKVKKGDVLATLFVPELVEDFGTKKATVKLDEERVELAKKLVEVADADVKAAKARLDEAKAILAKYQSEVDRWDTEVKRLDHEVKRGVVDPQILLESTNQWKSAAAARDAAKATIAKAEAELLSREATLAKARVDVAVAQADLSVAISEAKRIEAWVGYITLPAPYDGIVVARNANTGDFVVPSAGDPTANVRSPYLGPGGQSAPIYVVDRTDIVRIFVDIPEQDANYVHIGSKATVLAKAYRDEPISGAVTRTSWALNIQSRTLRAEIDLPNPGSQLLPGMYAYAKVIIERPGAKALPVAALTHSGPDRGPHGHQRRGLDRGHQPHAVADVQRRRPVDAGHRQGEDHPRRPVDPRRWRPGRGRPRAATGEGRDRAARHRAPSRRGPPGHPDPARDGDRPPRRRHPVGGPTAARGAVASLSMSGKTLLT
jgi:multidrug efflux pump subunit AcrA (membrane-fusion protein)